MTSNVAKSLNSALQNARKFSVCTVIEFIRGLIQKWIHERGEKAAERTKVLTEHVTKALMSKKAYSNFMTVKAINLMNSKWVGHDLYSYCTDYFKTDNLRQLYSGHIYHVGHPDDWQVSIEIKLKIVLPLFGRVAASQPQSTRFPSSGEQRHGHRKQQVCSLCKQLDHNRVNYPNEHVIEHTGTSQREDVAEGSKR
ncbi:hypothetical protein PTKIN_Ptkin16aG0051800 [Pterospermum kingtungense]